MFRVPVFAILSLLVLILAACGEAATPAAGSLLDGPAQTANHDQVKQAIDDLYTHHPNINTFSVQSVSYTPETRDKVLKICSEGSVALTAQERESQQVMACAPLIYYYYSYGTQSAVPEAVDVARQLYWFAVSGKSATSSKALTDLLRSWGLK